MSGGMEECAPFGQTPHAHIDYRGVCVCVFPLHGRVSMSIPHLGPWHSRHEGESDPIGKLSMQFRHHSKKPSFRTDDMRMSKLQGNGHGRVLSDYGSVT